MRASCAARIDVERAALRPIDDAGDIVSSRVPALLCDVEMTVTCASVVAGERIELQASAKRIGLAVMIEGAACFAIDGVDVGVRVSAGQAILNAHLDPVMCTCQAAGRVVRLSLPRNAAQAWASEVHGGARRLARAVFVFQADAGLAALGNSGCESMKAGAVIQAVIAALASHEGIDVACPASRSISLARRRLDADPSRAWDLDDLARGVGVTPVTLQRGFRDCVGVTVASYAQRIRLSEARTRLASARETRPVSAIAHAAGFASVTAFARAYQRVFGETPTKTRADHARFPHGVHIESD
ncbi:helix-turn-helix transcriptional regulator [Sphingomonas koreensis]|uniref:helix-turn-helix transcriptional regulator n=1 Tax=Sphingomonas koreensis TaxID=93064 RepID=UPI000B184F90|nr:AraC family transcriptional regulator [Sphingomonas koreensis]PJI89671.1 AraC-like DNA-binding protein [Sphingomonas koreensis]